MLVLFYKQNQARNGQKCIEEAERACVDAEAEKVVWGGRRTAGADGHRNKLRIQLSRLLAFLWPSVLVTATAKPSTCCPI